MNLPPLFEEEAFRRWGVSLGYSLRTGMRQLYMLEGSEVEFELEGPWVVREQGQRCLQAALTFIDAAVGGSGFLERVASEMHLVARQARDHLDHADCETACYRCLKSYQNQRFHTLLSWPHALPDLEALQSAPPRCIPLTVRDKFNARAWLDAYEAGVGSPLELKFLRLFEAKNLKLEKQVPISLTGCRTATVADFALPAQRLAIYIDGAAFHHGENLRRDRFIRDKLRHADPPWTVIELTARDLSQGLGPLQPFFGAFPESPDPEPQYELEDPTVPPPASTLVGEAEADQDGSGNGVEDEFPGYEILEEITGGGMARCLKVRARDSGELCFLKSVRVGSTEEHALERELDIYSKLSQLDSSEHLVQVRDRIRAAGTLSLVTELADGGDLQQFVNARAAQGVPPREALPIALEICQGLQDLHESNIVHRDLKPQNILRAGGHWRLADFGIAKNRARAAPGVTFQQAGTLGYAAPEQLEGIPADPSTDVFSFGKVLTYLLTGTTDPDRIDPELSDLRKLVYRCVQYVPESRPTMENVRAALAMMNGEG